MFQRVRVFKTRYTLNTLNIQGKRRLLYCQTFELHANYSIFQQNSTITKTAICKLLCSKFEKMKNMENMQSSLANQTAHI